MIEINWHPDARTLRWFAGLQIVFFLIVAWLWRESLSVPGAGTMIGVSLAVGAVGLARPPSIRLIYVAWMVIVFPIGWVMSHVVLAVVYFLVLTPIAIVVRWRRGDPLNRRFDPDATSYWSERPAHGNVRRYFRQY